MKVGVEIRILSPLGMLRRTRLTYMGGGGMGEKMGGPEIFAKRGVLGKFFVIEGGSPPLPEDAHLDGA